MASEKMEFVATEDIPQRTGGGRAGRDWQAVFDKIPLDGSESWKIKEDNKEFRIPTIIKVVKRLNDEAGKKVFRATMRTVEGKVQLYVTRVLEG